MQKHLPDDRRFSLADLVEKLDDRGKELGLIIDLTNTDRYYKATVRIDRHLWDEEISAASVDLHQDIADAQIQYHKLMTPGHNQIPNEACYQQFAQVVRTFLEQNQHNGERWSFETIRRTNLNGFWLDKLLGVHCTHGLNRPGYLIVRSGINLSSAIVLYSARPTFADIWSNRWATSRMQL